MGSCQLPLQQIRDRFLDPSGWVTEWSIVHAWKACVLKGTEGSNPSPSARESSSAISRARVVPRSGGPGESSPRCLPATRRENSHLDKRDNLGPTARPD